MKSKLSILLLAIFFIIILERCKHNPTEEVTPINLLGNNGNGSVTQPRDTICFSSDILPLIISTCAKPGCHDAITKKDGYNFTNYTNIRQGVVVGNPSQSAIYYYAIHGSSKMKNSTQSLVILDTASLAKIAKWINQGAINSICNNCDTVNVKYSTHIKPLIQSYCAGCHTSTSGTLLTNYTQVNTTISNGKFYCAINQTTGCLPMPQGGAKLSACKIRMVKIWIDAGALNN